MSNQDEGRIYALLDIDTIEWGCPHCGSSVINDQITEIESSYCFCSVCDKPFKIVSSALLNKGGKKSRFNQTDQHPRKNISVPHKANIKITYINTITNIEDGYSTGCFICGGQPSVQPTFSFCVNSISEGVEIFKKNPKGIWFFAGSRRYASNNIIVGSCNRHVGYLVKLLFLLSGEVFTQELLEKAKE